MKITSTKNIGHDRLKMLIVGPSGAGKTTLASTINEETLIISAESGLLSLSSHDIDVYDLTQEQDIAKRYSLIIEAYKYLQTEEAKKKYKWIYIDSLTELSQILVAFLKKKYPDKKDALSMWGEYNDGIISMIKSFRDLPTYNVVFTALQSVDKDDNGKRFYGVEMFGKISNKVEAFFDELFTLRVIDNDKGETKRALLTQRQDPYIGKDRSGKLDLYEPANLSAIMQKITGDK